MLDTYEKFRIKDESGDNHFFVEVNWDLKDKKINECKLLKITFPDGKIAYVKRELMHEMLFAIGDAESQKKMIPQKVIHTKWLETVLGIKATKDIRKGEMINVPVKISLPSQEEEIIGKLRDQGWSRAKQVLS